MASVFPYLFAIIMAVSTQAAIAQNYEDIVWREYTEEQGFSWSAPADWQLDEDKRYVAVMWSPENEAYCTLKRTADWSFTLMTPKTHVENSMANLDQLERNLLLQYPNGDGKLIGANPFPVGNTDGFMFMTRGTMNDQSVTHAGFQAIWGGAVFTLACFTTPENFGYFFPIFSQVADRLSFPN